MGKHIIFKFLMLTGMLLSMEIHARNSDYLSGNDSLKTNSSGNIASNDTASKNKPGSGFFLFKFVKNIFGTKSNSTEKKSSSGSVSKVQNSQGSKDSLSGARKDSSSHTATTPNSK